MPLDDLTPLPQPPVAPEPDNENVALDEAPAPETDTGADEVLDNLYGGGEVEAPEPQPERQPAPPPAEQPSSPQSQDDQVTAVALQYEVQNLERDLQDFARAKAKVEELAKTDPERAKTYAQTLRASEQELRQRYEAIEGAAQQFTEGQQTRHRETELEKMVGAVPDLATAEAKAALKNHIINERGFSEQEYAQAADHRLIVMAWEAMQYRKMMGGRSSTTTTQPKPKPLPKPPKRRAAKKQSPGKAKFEQSVANFKEQHGRPPTNTEEAAIRIYGHGKPDTFTMPKSNERDAADILYGSR